MSAVQMKRLKNFVPVISNRLAGKTEGLVRKMKKLQIIEEDEFSDAVNPPDKVFEKLADSGNTNIWEDLKTEMIKEGLKETVLEIIEGKKRQTQNPTERVSDKTSTQVSSVDDSSDSYSEHKLKTEDRRKMVPVVGTVEELVTIVEQGFSQMNEKLEQISREGKEREEKLWRMIMMIDMKKEELIQDLENNQVAYDKLKQQFDDLQNHYDALENEMKTMESKEKCLTEENKRLKEKAQRLQKQIDKLGNELVSVQPTNRARRNKYSELVHERNVQEKQGKGTLNPKKIPNLQKSGK